ncbi:MAG: BON domain-containing protein [Nitrospirae bacterium]|nr:BON domain-containing protein [Nitrospirota bacterium]
MSQKEMVIKAVRAAFEREPRINLHRYPVHIDFSDGVLTLEGEVEDIAAKKLGMELAIAVPGVRGIVDRLHVVPAARMGDGAVLDAVRDALLQEPALRNCTIRVKHKGKVETVREPPVDPHGVIEVSVTDGVVLLDNHVTNLVQKRLAGVLAWWVPGSRDVINGMEVVPPEEDSDDQVTKAVRLALKKDPFVNVDRIRVSTRNSVVTLEGSVPTDVQKEMAEFDAWYVFGVDKVVNKLAVQR